MFKGKARKEAGDQPEAAPIEQPNGQEPQPSSTVPLGRLLVERDLLTEEQLNAALAQQEQSGKPLGQVLVELGFLPEASVAQALATQHGGVIKTEYGFATGFGDVPARKPLLEEPLISPDDPFERPLPAPTPETAQLSAPAANGAPKVWEPRPSIGPDAKPAPEEAPSPPPKAAPSLPPAPVRPPAPASGASELVARVEQLEAELVSVRQAQEALRAEVERLSAEAGPDRDLQDRLFRSRLVELEQRIDSALAQLTDSPEAGAVR